jgi:hypothetical protein
MDILRILTNYTLSPIRQLEMSRRDGRISLGRIIATEYAASMMATEGR